MSDGRLPTTEIPRSQWERLEATDYTSEDMIATMDAFNGVRDTMSLNLMLGARGVILATRIRLEDFGELADEAGMKINEKKQDPLWLGTEAMAIMENQGDLQGPNR
jgi:hypothetical protein